MLKITKKGDYGLTFLTALAKAKPKTFVPLKSISQTNHLPYKFISQIALQLKAEGLVKSKEGLGGGYRLNKTPEKISLAKILETLEGPIAPVACLRGKRCLNQKTCQHQKIMLELTKVVQNTLKAHNLADLAKRA